jgi:hypothetical protein
MAAATGVTLMLGVIAVVTAVRLRQLSTVPVAPNVPESQPRAQTAPTPTPPATLPACMAAVVVETSVCGGWCNDDSDCTGDNLVCNLTGDTGMCVSSACEPSEQDNNCVCAVPTNTPAPSPSPTPTGTPAPSGTPAPTATPEPTATPQPGVPTPTPLPQLPQAGVIENTILVVVLGTIFILGGIGLILFGF